MYVYLISKNGNGYNNLYNVGFYSPDGKWNPEQDYENEEEAANRVAWLNGGGKSGSNSKPSNGIKITSISFGLTKNLGNYESSRLDMSVEIQEGEDWEETLRQLKVLVNDQIGGIRSSLKSLSEQEVEKSKSPKEATDYDDIDF